MSTQARLSLPDIEHRVCDIASEVTGIHRTKIFPHSRLIQDLHCDSIDFLDLIFRLEKQFDITVPVESEDPIYKSVFTRKDLRVLDMAELVYLHQGSARIKRRMWSSSAKSIRSSGCVFTQLGGTFVQQFADDIQLFDHLGENQFGYPSHRRRTDGMICVEIPAADVIIGNDGPDALPDEKPVRQVHLDSFLIDQEPVSTSAYCRFLNSIGAVDRELLEEWFILAPDDKRQQHELLQHGPDGWTPLPGTERMPMMLVSWFGADAYAKWANRRDWKVQTEVNCFLPNEAQFEYAARGCKPQNYPWGNAEPTPDLARYGQHICGQTYLPEELPMADVNTDLGISPFGLRHMAGNVWQWCNDWYAPHIRSERGGSWVGPAILCRSSYRRGRVPEAKGRCLGFRCISPLPDIHK
jgi:acyl carrier protein